MVVKNITEYEDNMIGLIVLQVVLIGLNAVFASAEIAVLSINEVKLERMAEDGNKKAKRLFKLTKEPARFLATIQVAITLSGFLGSAFAADNFSEPLVEWIIGLGVNIPRGTLDAIAVVFITLILSYFTLIFGELVPKRVAMKRSEQLAFGISGLVSGISYVFKPIVWLLTISTNLVLQLLGINPDEANDEVSEEEIRMMVDEGSKKGTIDQEERVFINNVFEFDDLTAGEIIVHRTDVTILWMEDNMKEWDEIIHNSHHTRYPICEGSADNVIGILNAKIYFRLNDKNRENVMANAVRKPFFVPETIKADVLFRKMKRTHNNMAIVIDEYGGMEGIVTKNDLIEQLVGDLGEDGPNQGADEPHIEQTGETTWSVRGNVGLREIEKTIGIDFGETDVDTITGFVFSQLGMVPNDGKQDINIDVENISIHVTGLIEHQIAYATIKKHENDKQAMDISK